MVSWEYKEVVVRLGINASAAADVLNYGQDGAVRQAAINAGSSANYAIGQVLQREGAEGWEPTEATDLLGLLLAGRVSWRQTGGVLFTWKFRFDDATIALRRARPVDKTGEARAGGSSRSSQPERESRRSRDTDRGACAVCRETRLCWRCAGKGRIDWAGGRGIDCPTCDGSGRCSICQN
jgi:hypothetical protein